MSIKVCVSVSPALKRGGQMWVYLNWCLGLKEIGCRVVWLDRLASSTGRTPTQQFSDLQTHLQPYGLAGEVAFWTSREEPLPTELSGKCHEIDAVADEIGRAHV